MKVFFRTQLLTWFLTAVCGAFVLPAGHGDERLYYFVDERGVSHFSNVPADPRYRPLPERGAAALQQSRGAAAPVAPDASEPASPVGPIPLPGAALPGTATSEPLLEEVVSRGDSRGSRSRGNRSGGDRSRGNHSRRRNRVERPLSPIPPATSRVAGRLKGGCEMGARLGGHRGVVGRGCSAGGAWDGGERGKRAEALMAMPAARGVSLTA